MWSVIDVRFSGLIYNYHVMTGSCSTETERIFIESTMVNMALLIWFVHRTIFLLGFFCAQYTHGRIAFQLVSERWMEKMF